MDDLVFLSVLTVSVGALGCLLGGKWPAVPPGRAGGRPMMDDRYRRDR